MLVHSAAGGVGLQALQILSKTGAAVLGLVGGESKVALLQDRFAGVSQQQQQKREQEQEQKEPPPPRPYFEFAVRQGDAAAAAEQLSGFLDRAGCSGFGVILDSLGPGECTCIWWLCCCGCVK